MARTIHLFLALLFFSNVAAAAVSIHEADFDGELGRSRTGGVEAETPTQDAPPAGAAAAPAGDPEPEGRPAAFAEPTREPATDLAAIISVLVEQGLEPVGILATVPGTRTPKRE